MCGIVEAYSPQNITRSIPSAVAIVWSNAGLTISVKSYVDFSGNAEYWEHNDQGRHCLLIPASFILRKVKKKYFSRENIFVDVSQQ